MYQDNMYTIQCSSLILQVHLQTQQEGKSSVIRITANIIKKDGLTALYNGLSASLLRQLTYSTVRFGIYEVKYYPFEVITFRFSKLETMWILSKVGKQAIESPGNPAPFYQKFLLAAISGAAGGIVGTPADLINVRMQNDMKLSMDSRRK